MKLIKFKIISFIFAGFALLALNGCNGTTGTSSDSGLSGTTTTYFENNTSYPIPDYTTTTSEINATNAVREIAKVTVTINITQPWVTELEIHLISPTGTNILLSSNNGSSGGYYNVTFDDDALTSIIGAPQPLTDGTYYPEEPLANFDGEDANGVWTLSVTETNGWNDGNILTWWNITIE